MLDNPEPEKVKFVCKVSGVELFAMTGRWVMERNGMKAYVASTGMKSRVRIAAALIVFFFVRMCPAETMEEFKDRLSKDIQNTIRERLQAAHAGRLDGAKKFDLDEWLAEAQQNPLIRKYAAVRLGWNVCSDSRHLDNVKGVLAHPPRLGEDCGGGGPDDGCFYVSTLVIRDGENGETSFGSGTAREHGLGCAAINDTIMKYVLEMLAQAILAEAEKMAAEGASWKEIMERIREMTSADETLDWKKVADAIIAQGRKEFQELLAAGKLKEAWDLLKDMELVNTDTDLQKEYTAVKEAANQHFEECRAHWEELRKHRMSEGDAHPSQAEIDAYMDVLKAEAEAESVSCDVGDRSVGKYADEYSGAMSEAELAEAQAQIEKTYEESRANWEELRNQRMENGGGPPSQAEKDAYGAAVKAEAEARRAGCDTGDDTVDHYADDYGGIGRRKDP